MRRLAVPAITLAATLAAPSGAVPQARGDSVTVVPGPHYAAGRLRRFAVGDGYREVWTTPLRVPVLDLRGFAGGLEPLRQGGGHQSITLHMTDAKGSRWIFRSVDKLIGQAPWPELHGTFAARVVRDHVSALRPDGALVMPELLEAAGVLHVRPRLYVMPDDPVLGEYRETFAGMLGALEARADEGPDASPGFAGSRRVTDTAGLFEALDESARNRVDEREFLRVRLIDMLVGDPDRGTDQWRWARFDDGDDYVWRPIPIDRDWAFVRGGGVILGVARYVYPKMVRFGPKPSQVQRLTYSSHLLDRRLLTRLTLHEFMAEAARVQTSLADSVIARAVGSMPPEFVKLSSPHMVDALRARRDLLPEIAGEFYEWLAGEVDVRGTEEADVADVERFADGSVLVRIGSPPVFADVAAWPAARQPDGLRGEHLPYYERRFMPSETREVRLYLYGGDDRARVHGVAGGPIVVRVIGGPGDDVLEDLAGDARLYDDHGANRFVRSNRTAVDERPWVPPPAPEGLRAGFRWAPDWGAEAEIGPGFDRVEGAGFAIGAGPSWRRYGFRRLPHQWEIDVRALIAPRTGRPGIVLEFDHRGENTQQALIVGARATRYEAFRFFGFGNDSPDDAGALIGYDRIGIEPVLQWELGPHPGRPTTGDADTTVSRGRSHGRFAIGPVFRWTDARADGPLPWANVPGLESPVTQFGAQANLDLWRTDGLTVPRRGFRLRMEASGFPLARNTPGAFGNISARAAAYVPLPGSGPHVALRLGGERAFGGFPAFEAASLGGRNTLRGHRTGRYTGDTALHGAVELRVPIDTVRLILRGDLGVFAFGDAGRIWHDGRSDGALHTGVGAGAWFTAFGKAVGAAVAHGAGTRLHAWLGLPF